MGIEIDHSGMGASFLIHNPTTPILHGMDEPCATCDGPGYVNPLDTLRAAITAAIADLRGRHVPRGKWYADERPGNRCNECDYVWPCPDALLADRLEEATDGR